MEPALFGLVGVVAGALIASAGEYLRTTRAESREDNLTRDKTRIELRTAVRLVDEELFVAAGVVLNAVKNPEFWTGEPRLVIAGYESSKVTLARHLPFAEWQKVVFAMVNIGHISMLRDAPYSEAGVEVALDLVEDVHAAREVLREYREIGLAGVERKGSSLI